ncbi:hypothetical protein [Cognatilysobacter terrigena]|nr:hypothetical protein [Lysobacter terrigena]
MKVGLTLFTTTLLLLLAVRDAGAVTLDNVEVVQIGTYQHAAAHFV